MSRHVFDRETRRGISYAEVTPTQGAGFNAPVGHLLVSGGTLWQKQGAGATAWGQFAAAAGYLPLTGGTLSGALTTQAAVSHSQRPTVSGVNVALVGDSIASLAPSDFAIPAARSTADYNSATFRKAGFYGMSNTNLNRPADYAAMIVLPNPTDAGTQIASAANSDSIYFRRWTGNGTTYNTWREFIHSGNFNTLGDARYSLTTHSHSFAQITGTIADTQLSANVALENTANIFSANQQVTKSNAWLTLQGTGATAEVDQASGISIGESGFKGSAAVHLTYTGDGYGHLGMGVVSATTNLPAYEVLRMHYASTAVNTYGTWTFANSATFSGQLTVTGAANLNGAVRIVDTGDASLVSTAHPFQIGASGGLNIVADSNEIMARNNGVAATLNINYDGGLVYVGAGGIQTAGAFTGNGSGLTNLPAGNLTGTVLDARLSANVALKNVANTFAQMQTFDAGAQGSDFILGTGTPSGGSTAFLPLTGGTLTGPFETQSTVVHSQRPTVGGVNVALVSDVLAASSVEWANVTNKPATALRWPSFAEVTTGTLTSVMGLGNAAHRGRVSNGASGQWFFNVAAFAHSTGGMIGAVVIKTGLIAESVNTMATIRITGYDYSARGPFEMVIGCYFYANGTGVAKILNPGYRNTGQWKPVVTAQIAPDGYWCIVLGGVADTTGYLKIAVPEVMLGHDAVESRIDGWSIFTATDLTGYVLAHTFYENTAIYARNISDVLAATQIPTLDIGTKTSGTLAVTRGGTGVSGWTANRVVYATATTTLGQVAVYSTANNGFLRQNASGVPAFARIAWDDVDSRPYWLAATNLISSLTDFNTLVPSGFYEGSSAANAPTASTWYNVINVRHSASNAHGFQLAMSYYTTELYGRSYQGNAPGTFAAWQRFLHGGNYGAFSTFTSTVSSPSFRAEQNIFINGRTATADSASGFGYGLVGKYSSTRYQGVFAMGPGYELAVDGLTPGTLYGLAWTHSNVGGQSKAGLSHQLLVMENGVTKTALGTGVWTSGNVKGTTWEWQANGSFFTSDGTWANLYTVGSAALGLRAGLLMLSGNYSTAMGAHRLYVDGTAFVSGYVYQSGASGLYNTTSDAYWYFSGGYWNTQQPSSVGGIILRGHTSNVNTAMINKGRLYFDDAGVGLLNDQGGWSVRAYYGAGYGGELVGSWNTTGSATAGGANSEHIFRGGDGGNGTTAFRVNSYNNARTGFYVRGDGSATFNYGLTIGAVDSGGVIVYGEASFNGVTNVYNDLYLNRGGTAGHLNLNRASGVVSTIKFYSYTGSWIEYMSPGSGASPGGTALVGSLVTSWALRSVVEPAAGYGWTWETASADGATGRSIAAELRYDGAFNINSVNGYYISGNQVLARDTNYTYIKRDGVTKVYYGAGDIYTDSTAHHFRDSSGNNYGRWNNTGLEVASWNLTAGYTDAALQIREYAKNGVNANQAASYRPRIAFHWGGIVAAQIGIETSGAIRTLDANGTGYVSMNASDFVLA